jgi:hypothetical protein
MGNFHMRARLSLYVPKQTTHHFHHKKPKTMKKPLQFAIALIAGLFLMLPSASPAGAAGNLDVVEVETVLELREQDPDGSTVYRLTGEAILTFQQNFRGQKFIQDETAGILIDDNSRIITTTYKLNDGITGITGTLTVFRNNYQFVPVEDPGDATSSGNEPVIVDRTLDEITADDQGRLVRIADLEFAEADHGKTFSTGTNYTVSDPSGPGVFRTEFFNADYIGAVIPDTSREVVAIVIMFNDTRQIVSRSVADLKLTDIPNIRALRNQVPGTEVVYTLSNEVILTFQQGWQNQKWVQDETAGIMIHDPDGIITTAYEINDGIKGIKARLGIFRNNMQLLPAEDPGEASSSGNEPVVAERTLAEITADDQGRLVLVSGLSFDESHHGKNFATGTSYSVADETGTLVFRTEFFDADYIGTSIPVVPQDVTAIVHMFNNTRQIVSRSLEDFEAAGEVPVYSVGFDIVDENGDPLEGATITVQDVAYEEYVIEDLLPGTYIYTVSLDGYHAYSGQFLLVSEDLEVEVMLIAIDPFMVNAFPWMEGFEEDFPPEGWNHYQLGDAGNWVTHSTAFEGDFAAHHTFTSPGEEANSWLVTPQIKLPEDEVMVLSFFERNAAMGDYGYSGVMISAGSGNPELGHFTEIYESDVARGTYTERALNLADFMGKVVYIAFVYQGEDAHGWWVDNVLIEQAPDVFDMPDIATLVAEGRTDGTVYRITGEVIITHLQQAYRGQLYLQDESAAILVDDPTGILETAYEVYDGITGFTATLTMFQDMYQVVPTEDPGPPNSTGNTLEPTEVTLSQLVPEMQGMLVIVRNVTFKEGNPAVFTHNQSYYILDATAEGEIRTPNSAGLLDYFGTDVPEEPRDIIGVLHQRFEVTRLQPRALADFLEPDDPTGVPVTETRAFSMYPNPAQDYLTIQSADRIDHVRVFDLGGRMLVNIQVNGPQVQLQTGSFQNGLYIVQVVSGREVMNQRLQISR